MHFVECVAGVTSRVEVVALVDALANWYVLSTSVRFTGSEEHHISLRASR